jgi:hypothetical protein
MADLETELKRLNTRQEAIVSAMHGLTDIMEQTRDLVTGVVHFPPILGYTGAQNHRPARVGFWWKDVLFERR